MRIRGTGSGEAAEHFELALQEAAGLGSEDDSCGSSLSSHRAWLLLPGTQGCGDEADDAYAKRAQRGSRKAWWCGSSNEDQRGDGLDQTNWAYVKGLTGHVTEDARAWSKVPSPSGKG